MDGDPTGLEGHGMSDATGSDGQGQPSETLTVDQWRHVVDSVDTPWLSEVSDAIAGALGIATPKADAVIDAAIADGTLSVEKTDAYWWIAVNDPDGDADTEDDIETVGARDPDPEPEPDTPPAPRLGAQVDANGRVADHADHARSTRPPSATSRGRVCYSTTRTPSVEDSARRRWSSHWTPKGRNPPRKGTTAFANTPASTPPTPTALA